MAASNSLHYFEAGLTELRRGLPQSAAVYFKQAEVHDPGNQYILLAIEIAEKKEPRTAE